MKTATRSKNSSKTNELRIVKYGLKLIFVPNRMNELIAKNKKEEKHKHTHTMSESKEVQKREENDEASAKNSKLREMNITQAQLIERK